MVRLTVMYPKTADSTFDLDYYLTKHMPLARERLSTSGLTATHIDEGLGGGAPGEPAPYAVICTFTFETILRVQGFKSVGTLHGYIGESNPDSGRT